MKIKSKKTITFEQPVPVYDIEVPSNHNFALSCGVIVHNSKDISDSVVGAMYNASLHEPDLTIDLPEITAGLIIDTNTDVEGDGRDILSKLVPITKGVSRMGSDDNIIDNSISIADAVHDYIASLQNRLSTEQSTVNQPELVEDAVEPDRDPKDIEADRIREAIAHARAMQEGRIAPPEVEVIENRDKYDNLLIF